MFQIPIQNLRPPTQLKRKQKQKPKQTLQLPENELMQRLESLTKFKEYYLSTIKIEDEKQAEQPNKHEYRVEGDDLYIGTNKYNLNDIDQKIKDEILKHLDDLDKHINIARNFTQISNLTIYQFYLMCHYKHMQQQDICVICQFELFEVKEWDFTKQYDQVAGLQCGHYFHLDCLNGCIQQSHLQCPTCLRIYGVKHGDQPNGNMYVQLNSNLTCEGYDDVGTIVIEYEMDQFYKDDILIPSTRRTAFLPDTIEGRQILRLLKTAFQRRLVFTVGRSVTTGIDNQIVWNGIHHKTKLQGGSARFGYPDPTYFNRVREELAAKGVI